MKIPISFFCSILLMASLPSCLMGQGNLIWSDEFDGAGLPDPTKWRYDVGAGGWGNQELQFYTEGRMENARVENGSLILEALREDWPSSRNKQSEYTSARLVTKGFGDWRYGRVDVRAKLPGGAGTWSAIWLLSTGNAYGNWPRSGEIDIMEHLGRDPQRVFGSLHTFAQNWLTGGYPTAGKQLSTATSEFHVYSLEWRPDTIHLLVDGEELLRFDNPGTGWEAWPFDQPFHLILNIAVGGTLGGAPEPETFPARMEVDYVRVYDLGDTIALDTDGDQDPNTTDPDDDGDGLTDAEEHELGTNLIRVDTDNDGFSDFEEVEAGTFPLLVGSFPGSDASVLMINNDFEYGEEPWIVHTNKLDESGGWIGQAGSWGGAYSVFDHVSSNGDGTLTFSSFTEGDAPQAEHLVYQEWSPQSIELVEGDTIRFRGVASSAVGEGFSALAFIRVLDTSFQPLGETVTLELGADTESFELVTVLPSTFNVLQSGFSITGPQTESASVTFSALETTLNEAATWAGWVIEEGLVNTGGFLGWLSLENDPWLWSYTLNDWVFADESLVGESGGWIFLPR